MRENKFYALILAAGKGTRMKSDLPKVLHEIKGKPLLGYVLDTAKAAGAKKIIVIVGHQAQKAELRGLLGMRGDEGAAALAPHEQVLGREFVDRLSHRALADLEAARQLDLAGDRLARAPDAGLQFARHQRLHLLVQRAERRACRVGWSTAHDAWDR